MITGLAHICILAEDLEATRAFYCDVLGFTKQFDFIKDDALFGYYLKINDSTFIEVFKAGEGKEQKAQRISHYCLETDDIDAVYAKLIEHGIPVRGEKTLGSDSSWQIWTKDPNGIDFEFHQYTDKSSQVTGADCIVNW